MEEQKCYLDQQIREKKVRFSFFLPPLFFTTNYSQMHEDEERERERMIAEKAIKDAQDAIKKEEEQRRCAREKALKNRHDIEHQIE